MHDLRLAKLWAKKLLDESPLPAKEFVNVVVPVESYRYRALVNEGWQSPGPHHNRGDGYAVLQKAFGSNKELKHHLDIFADYRLTAWVSR